MNIISNKLFSGFHISTDFSNFLNSNSKGIQNQGYLNDTGTLAGIVAQCQIGFSGRIDTGNSSIGMGDVAQCVEEGIRDLLQTDSSNQINEEQLFSAVLGERILNKKGAEVAGKYLEAIQAELAKGGVSYEEAAHNALAKLVDEGLISREEASQMHAEAFEAAQLDDQTDYLFDGIGNDNDPTSATMDLDEALSKAMEKLRKYDNGTDKADVQKHGISATSNSSARPAGCSAGPCDGFLWKPVSDSNGKLVVLLPASISQDVAKVELKGSDGSVIEQGKPSGIANGNRAHFRFSKAGGQYPDGLTVEVTLKDGTKKSYKIDETSARVE